jgi:hypothetical protein
LRFALEAGQAIRTADASAIGRALDYKGDASWSAASFYNEIA